MTPPAPPAAPVAARANGTLVQAVVIILACLSVYAPVIGGGWLFDDNIEITDNTALQEPGGLRAIWGGSSEIGADYLPLKSTVEWVLWHLFGSHPIPFHLTNIALHLFSAFLLWRLLGRLGVHHAWVGGLLFAVHPLEVESVAWISELKNTLSLAFLMLAMLAWLSFDAGRRARDYAWSLAWFAAALLSKSSVIMWPVVMLLYPWWRRGGVRRRDVAVSLPFFALAAAVGVLTVRMQGMRAIQMEVYPLGGIASHVALAGMDIVFYLWKTVFPVGLLPMYPRWQIDPPRAMEFLPWAGLAVLGGWLWTKRRVPWGQAACFGLGFFVVNLLPVLGVLRMSFMRISWVADHFVYLSSLGIIGLAAAGLGVWYDRAGNERRSHLRTAGWLGLGVIVLAGRLHAQVYSDLETMSRYTVEGNPDAWLAHQLYAIAVLNRDADLALTQAREAVRLRPDTPETQASLGVALAANNRYAESVAPLQAAIRFPGQHWAIRERLALSLSALGRYGEALQVYRPLLQHTPQSVVLHVDAGVCFFGLGKLDEAIDQYRQALAIDPDTPVARDNLDVALKQRENAAQTRPPTDPP